MKLAVAALVLALLLPFTASAQDVEPVQDMKLWEPLVGYWINQEQQRESPHEPWQQVASEWEIRIMPGGFFVETPGEMRFPDGRTLRWVQVYGYDPSTQTTFYLWADTEGSHGRGTFEWTETEWHSEGYAVLADGTKTQERCTYDNDDNPDHSEGLCETLTDGNWWVSRKIKGAKKK
jgi:hypothetical protein